MTRVATAGHHPTRRIRGFTLIELLVVIAIIGVLVGLLLPAVQSCRENARSTHCRGNLLNLALAVETYHQTFSVYPAGTVTDRLPARMFPDGKDHSWLVQIRPFLDGGFEFAENWSPVHSAYHPHNWPLSKAGSSLFRCASSPFRHQDDVAPLSYAGIHDGRDAPIDVDSGGFFVANRFLAASDIVDGLGYTLQLGEIWVHPGDTFHWITGNQSTLRTTGIAIDNVKENLRSRSQRELRTSVPYGRYASPVRIDEAMLMNALPENSEYPDDFVLVLEQLSSAVEMQTPPLAIDIPQYTIGRVGRAAEQPLAIGSPHGAMVNAAMADGRVVVINQSIDPKLFAEIGIRNDHAPLARPFK